MKSATCSVRSAAPQWILNVALGILLVLSLVLAYQYLVHPAMTIERMRKQALADSGRSSSYEGFFEGAAGGKGAVGQKTGPGARKATFVFLHMTGCGWCERFRPTWDELVSRDAVALRAQGLLLEDHEASDPETKRYKASVSGYPTILLVKAGSDKSPIKYEGERTREAILEFLAKHGFAASGAKESFYAEVQRMSTGTEDLANEAGQTVEKNKVSEGTKGDMKRGGAKLPNPY